MTPQRFQEIRALFEAVVSRSLTERAPALRLLRERDSELAGEVDDLLAVFDRRSGFIERPTAIANADHPSETGSEIKGAVFGPYELVEMVGQGGMGQVWRANQLRPVRRTVALKLIKAGMDTQEVVRRFETERQALAVMDHPAIAKVFDAGSTPSGRPYFVMEYVAGIPITTFCDLHRLSIRERLTLFINVCEGIQHAHQKAIIHRDIKPSNVLVAEVDGKPSPRIIDFGVARAISSDGSGETALTRLGAILGTPEYMSPEQADSVGCNLDTRADVYSLGVLVYELVVGAVPHDNRGLPLAEVLRKIREEPAQRASVRFRGLGMDWNTAQNRRMAPSDLFEELRGDLDVVLLKALRRNPDARYGSPSELAADIARYLRYEPILARPASALYVTRKYLRRHWLTVLAAASLLLLLAAFAVWQNVEIHRITQERDRADRIAQFMTDMFQVSDPSESRGNRTTAREILDRSSRGIEAGLSNDPELRANLMSVMGRVYFGLGLYGQAESLFRYSLDSRLRLTGSNSLDSAQSMDDLAKALRAKGKPADAKRLDLTALEIRKRLLGPEHADTLKSINSVAADMEREGLYSEARRLQETVYRADLRILGPEHSDTLAAMKSLGGLLYTEGRLREAEEYARSAVKIQRRKLSPDHPETFETVHLLAAILCDQGRYPEAEALFRELLVTRTRVLGSEHPDTLRSMKALAVPLSWEGKLAEAERLDRKAVESQARILGPEDPSVLQSTSDLAHILADQGRYEEADKLARKVLEISARRFGAENPRTLFLAGALASILLQQGSLEEAEHIAGQTREAQIRVLGKDHVQTAWTTYTLARISACRGRAREAVALLRDAVEHGLNPGYMLRIEHEPNLRPLRGDPGFQSLVANVRQRLAPAKP